MKTIPAEALGRKAYYLKETERQRIRDMWVQKIAAEVEKIKAQCGKQIQLILQEVNEILQEIQERGNIPRGTVAESLRLGIWTLCLVIIAALGDFLFSRWMISYFGLNRIETILISLTIVILTLKAFDVYLEYFRRQFPERGNNLFLVLASLGIVAIFVLFLFSAEIRQHLQKVLTFTTFTDSPEEIVHLSKEFYQENSGSFIWLMLSLTLAFAIVGGVSYHIARSRISYSWSYLSLYRSLEKKRNELRRLSDLIIAQDARLPQFLAEFETGLVNEESEQRKKDAARERKNQRQDGKRQSLDWLLYFPLTLLIFSLLFFLLLRGQAKGAETHILLDMSKSVAVSDYTGKDTEFSKNIHAIEDFIRHRIAPGDGIKVAGITERSFSRPYVLLNECVDTRKGSFGEILARERLRLLKQWKKFDLKPCARATDIFGAIALSSISFSPQEKEKKLMIYSDMRNCTREVNIEKPERIDGEKVLAQIQKHGLIPQLNGVEVLCLGVHSTGKSLPYFQDLRKFWHQFFRLSKANLKIFSRERRIP
jgi:Co/Zn/Cd efflux system component